VRNLLSSDASKSTRRCQRPWAGRTVAQVRVTTLCSSLCPPPNTHYTAQCMCSSVCRARCSGVFVSLYLAGHTPHTQGFAKSPHHFYHRARGEGCHGSGGRRCACQAQPGSIESRQQIRSRCFCSSRLG